MTESKGKVIGVWLAVAAAAALITVIALGSLDSQMHLRNYVTGDAK